jgi:hypothetical protein
MFPGSIHFRFACPRLAARELSGRDPRSDQSRDAAHRHYVCPFSRVTDCVRQSFLQNAEDGQEAISARVVQLDSVLQRFGRDPVGAWAAEGYAASYERVRQSG